MKIFMLVSRVPWPLEKGDKLRAFHQLKNLAENHEVVLCCLADRSYDAHAMSELKKITPHVHVIRLNKFFIFWRLLMAVFSSKPFQVHYFFQRQAAARVRKLIEDFHPDHIYCQLIRTSEYVKHFHGYKKTIDYMDALSSGQFRRLATSGFFMKLLVREEANRLRAYENLIFDYFEFHSIISDQDRQLIFHPDRNSILVLPNGIDAGFFHPGNSRERKYDIVFTGNMSYPPNVDCAVRLVREILPIIRKSIPDATLMIAGATPSRKVLQLASFGVVVTGWLEDIRMAYDHSGIFMAPMRTGSGLQNKLLEAMCMELPCITSPLAGAAMKAIDGEHLLIGESNDELAELAVKLLSDKQLAQNLAVNGRKFATSNFNWKSTVQLLTDKWNQ